MIEKERAVVNQVLDICDEIGETSCDISYTPTTIHFKVSGRGKTAQMVLVRDDINFISDNEMINCQDRVRMFFLDELISKPSLTIDMEDWYLWIHLKN